MTQVENSVVSTTPWVDTYNPGAIPIIAAGNNALDASQIARIRDEVRRIHNNRINVDQALKHIILEGYYNMHTSQLEDYLLQYANPSAL
jgi:hypothetical protein